ncbi:MAG TPA: metalloregulator ArsR/SmtB family transcription factor [Pseudogracilibacillus sp.]|nr:metalloregulator ArsR/SmtB family transcription factor [Pseudogracilibacillus sp.]
MLKTMIDMNKAAMVLKLLGDQTRLTMVKILDQHDCCVCEFVEIFNVSQPSISQHLRKLRDVGLIEEERKGQWIFYSINKANEYYPFVESVLERLPSQDEKLQELEEKGTRIICC